MFVKVSCFTEFDGIPMFLRFPRTIWNLANLILRVPRDCAWNVCRSLRRTIEKFKRQSIFDLRLFSQCVTVKSMLDWNESSQFRLMVGSQRVSEVLLCFASLYFLLFPRLLRKLCQVSFSSLSRLVNHFLSCRLSSRINKFLSTNILTRSNTWQWK